MPITEAALRLRKLVWAEVSKHFGFSQDPQEAKTVLLALVLSFDEENRDPALKVCFQELLVMIRDVYGGIRNWLRENEETMYVPMFFFFVQ